MKTKTSKTEAPTTSAVAVDTKAKAPKVAKQDSPAIAAAKKALADARKAERPARAPKPKAEPRPTCTATKANGEPCTAKAKQGSDKCVDHQPAWERLTAEERNDFGAYVEGMTAEALAGELGWHRVKQIVKQGGFTA